jgi:hypothetical protein
MRRNGQRYRKHAASRSSDCTRKRYVMVARWILQGIVAAGAGLVLLAPAVLGDTCCANTEVGLEPASASPGATVRLTGLRCLAADGSGPLELKLDAYWLSAGDRAAEADPDTVPGPGLPSDLPSTDAWHPFDSVTPAADGTGNATITVPPLDAGTYQLWWTCDERGGPGSGIHYSTGPRLAVGTMPDTSTVADPPASRDSRLLLGLVFAVGIVPFIAALRRDRRGSRRRGR